MLGRAEEKGNRKDGPSIHAARVLLVSDDPITARTWAYLLSQKTLVCDLGGSASEALALWERDAFDLILIDVVTPALDDIDLCRQFRTMAINPILLLPPAPMRCTCCGPTRRTPASASSSPSARG